MLQKVRLKHEKCLELDSVLKIVSGEAGFEDSAERILALTPNYNYEDALNALKKTGDAYNIAAKFGTPRVSGVKNVNNALKRAKSGGHAIYEFFSVTPTCNFIFIITRIFFIFYRLLKNADGGWFSVCG